MDQRCQERAEIIERWIIEMDKAEEIWANLDASFDALHGEIFLDTSGTVDERKAKTSSDPRLKELRVAIGHAKRDLNRARRMHELALKAGDWEYGTLKIEDQAIKRQV